MRGAVISLRALFAFSSSVQSRPLPLPGSRTVVTPCPIQSLKTYSAGVPCSLPPMCPCMSTKPGRTYMPWRSISWSPSSALKRFSGSGGAPGLPAGATSAMRFFSITTSTGPTGGAPVPSITVTPRRIRRLYGPSPSARGGAGRIDSSFFSFFSLAFSGFAAGFFSAPDAVPMQPGRPPAAGRPTATRFSSS